MGRNDDGPGPLSTAMIVRSPASSSSIRVRGGRNIGTERVLGIDAAPFEFGEEIFAHRVCADRADETYVVPSRAEPAGHVGRAPSDPPSQCLGIDVVAGGGDALNTQDNVRRYDTEHNDLSHVHNLTHRTLGGYVRGHAQTQVALRNGLLVSVYPRPTEFTAGDSTGGTAKVPPCRRRSTLSAACAGIVCAGLRCISMQARQPYIELTGACRVRPASRSGPLITARTRSALPRPVAHPGHHRPPERNSPLPVTVAHGSLAVRTLVLVLLPALGGRR